MNLYDCFVMMSNYCPGVRRAFTLINMIGLFKTMQYKVWDCMNGKLIQRTFVPLNRGCK